MTEKGIIDTAIDTVRGWLGQKSEFENKSKEDLTVCVQDKVASKKSPANPTGSWQGGVYTVKSGETYRVDPSKNDIEGVVHSDGSVTKNHGNLWTSEHDKEWVKKNWPGCSGASGKMIKGSTFEFIRLDPAFSSVQSPYYTFARVDSRNNYWHEGRGLEPKTKYRVIPRSSDRWTYDSGRTFTDFHGGYLGDKFMKGSILRIPKDRMPIGGLIALVWDQQSDGTAIPRIYDFPLGINAIEFTTGSYGGSISFLIADLATAYPDNFGDCVVAIAKA